MGRRILTAGLLMTAISSTIRPQPSRGITAPLAGGRTIARTVYGPALLSPEVMRRIGSARRQADVRDGLDQGTPACTSCEIQLGGLSEPFDTPLRTPPPTVTPFTSPESIGGFDPQIAASRAYLVASTSSTIYFFTKDGKPLLSADPAIPFPNHVSAVDFFSPLAGSLTANLNLQAGCDPANVLNDYYDARVIFDSFRNRFFIGLLARNNRQSGKCYRSKFLVAVSLSEDPRDGFYEYWWDASINNSCNVPGLACPNTNVGGDYPSLGISDHYFVDTEGVGGNIQPYTLINVTDADAMAAGSNSPSGWSYWQFTHADNSTVTGVLQPAVHHGPGDGFTWIADTYNGNFIEVFAFNPAEGNFAPPLHRVSVQLPVPYTVIPPLGGTPRKPTFGDAPQAPAGGLVAQPLEFSNLKNSALKAAYRGGMLHLSFQDCVIWEAQQQTCSTSARVIRVPMGGYANGQLPADPAAGYRDRRFGLRNWIDDQPGSVVYYGLPEVEVNGDGTMVAVYQRSGQTVDPEVRYSAWFAGEADIRPSALLHNAQFFAGPGVPPGSPPPKDGKGNPILYFGGMDTSGIAVDPFDDTAVWMAQFYARAGTGPSIGTVEMAIGKVFGSPHPDLSIESIVCQCGSSQPALVAPGAKLSISVTTANHGDGASGPNTVKVYLSRDRTITATDFEIGRIDQVSIASGAVLKSDLVVTLPPGTPPGVYRIGAMADPQNLINEYSETNNGMAGPAITVIGVIGQ